MKIFHFLKIGLASLAVSLLASPSKVSAQNKPAAGADRFLVYFGTYTGEKSKGIYVSRLDLAGGKLSSPELAAETSSPSFLAIHPNRRFLYSVNEVSDFAGKKSGAVSAFVINTQTGKLTPLNQQSSVGDGPCHLVVDPTGKTVLVANYGSGSTCALPIQSDGRLGAPTAFIQHQGSSVNPQRQQGPHAHCVTLDPANRFAFVADLGLDKILIFKFDAAKGTLVANDPPSVSVKPGAGPRHFAFDPKGRYGYVINEIDCTLTGFSYDPARGALKELHTISTLPAQETFKPDYSTAEVEVHPSGKFVYGSNRGHHSLIACAIDQMSGKLTPIENESTLGKTPRSFGIDPTGAYLLAANQDSDSVAVFRIDPKTGQLSPTGQILEGVGKPVCVKFVSTER